MDALNKDKPLRKEPRTETPRRDEHVERQERLFCEAVIRLSLEKHELGCINDALKILHRLYKEVALREDGAKPMLHVLRVATRIAETSKNLPRETVYHHILAALFHDGVEDHAEQLARMGNRTGKDDHVEALQYISDTYGEEPAHIVAHTSKRPNRSNSSPDQKIASYVSYMRGVIQDRHAIRVKLADIRDNVTHPSPNRTQRSYAMRKYSKALTVIDAGLSLHKTRIVESWGHATYLQMKVDMLAVKLRTTLG